ncbi:MAG: SPFH domain-containing protein [Candidatus Gracilibacteria bacterium]|nr:SPFH domain-containing protein [Candidatus Gracilibacteria bacterium]
MLGIVIPILLLIVPVVFILLVGIGGVIPAILADLFLISLSVRIVKPNTVKSVEFFGKFNRVLRSGLNFIIPIFEITKEQVLFRINFPVDVDGVTKDNVTAYIGLNVIYYVEDDKDDSEEGAIFKSIYKISDPRTMIKSIIDQELRAMIVTFSHKEVFGKREEIGNDIEEKLREKLASFGYKLDSIQVRDVKLESSVMSAMNKVVESEKLKEAAMNQGEAEKIMQVKKAEAEKESKILLGQGMAGQRMEIARGFKESVDMIKASDSNLDGSKVLEFLLDSSRIETLGNIGDKDNTKLIYLNEDLEGRNTKFRSDKLIAGSDIM